MHVVPHLLPCLSFHPWPLVSLAKTWFDDAVPSEDSRRPIHRALALFLGLYRSLVDAAVVLDP